MGEASSAFMSRSRRCVWRSADPASSARRAPRRALAKGQAAPQALAAQIQRELARVTAALRTYQHASRGAQNAIESAIRGMGRLSLNTALLLLPPKVALPVGMAVRAVTRVLDRGPRPRPRALSQIQDQADAQADRLR
jgi:hypothetical protein